MDPGRSCPLSYRYGAAALNRPPELRADTLYVIGGLYGNVEALDAVRALAAAEDATLVFNGDFNWFNVDAADFNAVNTAVLDHAAIQGNVEAEIAQASDGAGCGCAYPDAVDAGVVERSNAIMARLQAVAAGFPALRARLAALPKQLVAEVGGLRVGIVHGDADSLAGWGFAEDALAAPEHLARVRQWFREAEVDVFACTHTCLPVAQSLEVDGRERVVINNGAAGMPNFRGDRRGLITRIGVTPSPHPRLYGRRLRSVHIDALPLSYELEAWARRFLAQWPPGSPAHVSYHGRIAQGPGFNLAGAVRAGFTLEAP